MPYEERTYRYIINNENLISYNIKISESDLFIRSDRNLSASAEKSLLQHRHAIESYIAFHPEFQTSLLPVPKDPLAPLIIRTMIAKSELCGVGPMASVAGAISEFVGNDLLNETSDIIIENGGDIFLCCKNETTVGLYAGESNLSYTVKILIKPVDTPLGICTSSATVGPSLSLGKADAVCVISKSATLADSAATAVGNRVKDKKDIQMALNYGIKISGVKGIIIIHDSIMGTIGDLEFVK